MPKRKRYSQQEDSTDNDQLCRQKVIHKLTQGKKQLHRALKLAKSFERQKLGKRLSKAETAEAKVRINLEIKVLKELDLNKVVDTQLYKSLLKVKSFVQSGLLPQEVKKLEKESREDAAEEAATNNVISDIFNMRIVKETIEQIVRDLYHAMRIPAPKDKPINKKISVSNDLIASHPEKNSENLHDTIQEFKARGVIDAPESPTWEAFESCEEILENGADVTFDRNELTDEELILSETRLGTSPDEDSFDENKSICKHDANLFCDMQQKILNASETKSSNKSQGSPPSKKISNQDERLQSRRSTQHKPASPVRPGLSTFLPTLMGGYWSGSEESASDLENFSPIGKKKNRPGQMARRAIAEKKYGKMANHIKSGKTIRSKSGRRDDGWDARRGAVDTTVPRGRSRYSSHSQSSKTKLSKWKLEEVKRKDHGKTHNSQVKSIRRHRDDKGDLHPSWQAAKKAKEHKQTAQFQGKKVIFD